jgi:hypothetical protein
MALAAERQQEVVKQEQFLLCPDITLFAVSSDKGNEARVACSRRIWPAISSRMAAKEKPTYLSKVLCSGAVPSNII